MVDIPARFGAPWTVAEIAKLRELAEAGRTVAEIAADMRRTDEAIRGKLRSEGIRWQATPRKRGPTRPRSAEWFLS